MFPHQRAKKAFDRFVKALAEAHGLPADSPADVPQFSADYADALLHLAYQIPDVDLWLEWAAGEMEGEDAAPEERKSPRAPGGGRTRA